MRLPLLLALAVAIATPAVALADPLDPPHAVVEHAAADAAATCRRDTPATDEQCAAVPLADPVSEAAVSAYEKSDVHRALALQYALGNDLPLRYAPWLGTHNSFNTTTREPTVSGLDSNQQLSMTDQLRVDMRSLEVDAHWFRSAAAGGGFAPVLCHAQSKEQQHFGCTDEPLLATGLDEIAAWVRAHPGQVVLVYLEDHLETQDPTYTGGPDDGYAAAATAVQQAFGDLLYAPGGTGCTPMPLDATRNDILAAGKSVMVISSCHAGAGWNASVFDDGERARWETGPAGYGEDGSCDPARPPAAFDGRLLRVFEDSTALTATVDQGRERITPGKAAALQRCAVDITGFDQILPGDGRLAASVWSWAPGEPAASGDCAVQGSDGRWRAQPCHDRHAFACRAADGTWSVDAVATPYDAASGRCRGAAVAAPRYGYEAVELSAAMKAAGVDTVWLGLTRTGDTWTPADPR